MKNTKNDAGQRTAIITGLRGQDAHYLSEHLLDEGYRVIGTTHASAPRRADLRKEIEVLELDLGSIDGVRKLIQEFRPTEVYNLAARSSSAQLFDDPIATADINGIAPVRFLEAIREHSPHTRFCQAASSELFAGGDVTPQDESTPYRPINAYGAAKAYATNMVLAYRLRHGIYATTAILFNHESPRRGVEYVTRKITHTVAKIAMGQEKVLTLGSLDAKRDWGFAGDYARAMWLMLQQPVAEDFVVATGVTHSVREFCEVAFSHVGLDYRDFVRVNPDWARRPEGVELRGNPDKARRHLNWQPSVAFADLVRMMVDADMVRLKSNTDQT